METNDENREGQDLATVRETRNISRPTRRAACA